MNDTEALPAKGLRRRFLATTYKRLTIVSTIILVFLW